MRWTHKAAVQRACASLPASNTSYSLIQRHFGRLNADPFKRLVHHRAMLDRLRVVGMSPVGARCFEVGTGHLPIVPLGFYLAGADEVVTVDLHKRIEWGLTRELIESLVHSEDDVLDVYRGAVEENDIADRLAVLGRAARQPKRALASAGIEYRAPADARCTADADGAFDIHFSVTVCEHIDPVSLAEILSEAARLLRPGGVAAHEIDLSDHYGHQDRSITGINFLRFGAKEWARIAGNEFGYCNRLRASEVVSLFTAAGLTPSIAERLVDGASVAALSGGFPLDPSFAGFAIDDLCTSGLSLYSVAA